MTVEDNTKAQKVADAVRGTPPEPFFPDGVYEVADLSAIRDGTQRGGRLVRVLPGSTPMFLILHKREAIEKADEEESEAWELKKQIRDLEWARREKEEEMAEFKRTLAASEKDAKTWHDRTDREVTANEVLGDRLHAMEMDFSKVRSHIGDRVWKEALEAEG